MTTSASTGLTSEEPAAQAPSVNGDLFLRLSYEKSIACCARSLLCDGLSEGSFSEAIFHLTQVGSQYHAFIARLEDGDSGPAGFHLAAATWNRDAKASEAADPSADPPRFNGGKILGDRMLGGETFSGSLQDIGIASDPWVEHHAADPALCAPIRVLGEWWGILGLVSVDGRWKSRPEDIRLLHTAADLFSVHFERRKTLADREEKNRLAGALEMAGVVCHKLNQPMQVILGYASMVTSGDIKDPAKVIDVVKLIEDETRQMGIITKNLMGITRIREAVSEETDG